MWRVIITFIFAALIIYFSYVCTKYIGKGMNKRSLSSYMRVVDQIMIGQDRYIAIVQVGERYLLVGITAGQINLLSELQEKDLLMLSSNTDGTQVNAKSFKEMIEKMGNFRKKGR